MNNMQVMLCMCHCKIGVINTLAIIDYVRYSKQRGNISY